MQSRFLIFLLSLNGIVITATCQDTSKLISSINKQLTSNQATVTEILSDASFMFLHPLTSFRNVIRQNAMAGKFTMVSKTEPGKRITVKGTVKDQQGNPLSDLLVYVYHTSDKGWYSDTGAHILIFEDDIRHARLFAYFKTDREGKFEFETVMPKGYPRSDLPAHIHIAMWSGKEFVSGIPDELLFDEDPRLIPARRKDALQAGFLIVKNSGTEKEPVYFYDIAADK